MHQLWPLFPPSRRRLLDIYHLILSWIPTADQYGPQAFCAGAIDNSSLQSNQWCITFLVGFESPDVIRPTLVQGSASPIGTIFQNHTVFSIQSKISFLSLSSSLRQTRSAISYVLDRLSSDATVMRQALSKVLSESDTDTHICLFSASKSVNRPNRNYTYIYFWDSTAGNTLVAKYDCGWQPEVTYTGFTTVVRFPTAPWIVGHFYYVTFDSGMCSSSRHARLSCLWLFRVGVASGTEFCGK